jgi:tetratricopeptide (TPR) repeat protein
MSNFTGKPTNQELSDRCHTYSTVGIAGQHVTIDSQLIDKACALREEGKFLEAYDLFMLAASQVDHPLEKARLLLNATTNLTQSNEQVRSRNHLHQIRELLETVKPSRLNKEELDDFVHGLVGIEIEEAEVLVTEGRIEAAIEQLTATLARFKDEIQEPSRIDAYDEIQTRRAYFLTDLDQFQKAIPILEEAKGRRNDDTIFLFYLGHCYFRAKRFDDAQEKLERALVLGPRPRIAFQAHGSLGMVFYETGDYQRAKQELETCARLAAPDYIKQAHIWKWLEYTCRSLGLEDEARRYGQLARPF